MRLDGWEQVELEQMQVHMQTAFSEYNMQGLQHAEWVSWRDMMADQVILGLRAYVFAELAGEKVTAQATDWVKVNLPLRPRWMPKWLWARVPIHQAKFVLRTSVHATPMWTYPSANMKVDGLGPQRFLVRDSSYTYRSWDDK